MGGWVARPIIINCICASEQVASSLARKRCVTVKNNVQASSKLVAAEQQTNNRIFNIIPYVTSCSLFCLCRSVGRLRACAQRLFVVCMFGIKAFQEVQQLYIEQMEDHLDVEFEIENVHDLMIWARNWRRNYWIFDVGSIDISTTCL